MRKKLQRLNHRPDQLRTFLVTLLSLWTILFVIYSLYHGSFLETLRQPQHFLLDSLLVFLLVTVLSLQRLLSEDQDVIGNLSHVSQIAQKVFESAEEGIITTDREGKITFINPAANKILGYEEGELVGKQFHDEVHPTFPDGTPYPHEDCPIDQALQEGGFLKSHDEFFLRKEGVHFPVLVSVSPLRDEDRIIGLLVIFTDISMWKAHEDLLRESELRNRLILDTAQDAFVSINANGKILDWNPKAEEIFGWTKSEMLGKDIVETIVPPSSRKAHREGMRRFLETRESKLLNQRLELNALHQRGFEFPVEITISALELEEQVVFTAFIHDIRKRKNMERQLRQSQKLEAIGTLAGGIAHDFNNILTSMIGFAELTKVKFEEGSKERKNIENILAGGMRARDLIKQMLSFSRQSEESKHHISLSPIVKESLKFLRSSLPSTISIIERIEPDNTAVYANPVQMQQIVMNLCTNAFQAMPNGGLIEITLETVILDELFCSTHLGLSSGSFVKLTVRDTGVGIKPEDLERIFEPFFTTKKVGEGTGLGLSVVHGIVNSHKGIVQVKSKVGEGTTVEVLIPHSTLGEEKPHPKQGATRGGTERVMIVDDEEMILQTMEGLLKRWGYHVSVFQNSQEALNAFLAKPEDYDLVITDMTMPRIPGNILAVRMLEKKPTLPIIICTGYHERISEEIAREIGIRKYLMKPIVANQLAKSIRDILDEGKQEV